MSFFKKNPNEVEYTGGKKHWTDVIKNTGEGNLLLWRNNEEDFNTNSTLIVAESEEALFYKDGVIEEVFRGGKYQLDTNNYPFISRLRNLFSGGISTFNCKVYFVRKAHTREVLWGIDSPIQVRDKVLGIKTSLLARGSYKVQIVDSKKFLIEMVGNNIQSLSEQELGNYFLHEMQQNIKSTISQYIEMTPDELLGICEHQNALATTLKEVLNKNFEEYGIELISFTVSGLDIDDNDPNRQALEAAFAGKAVKIQEAIGDSQTMDIYGIDWSKWIAAKILDDVANNNGGAGAAASLGAGFGVGISSAPLFSGLTSKILEPIKTESHTKGGFVQQPQTSRFEQKNYESQTSGSTSDTKIICPRCQQENPVGARFCNKCGLPLQVVKFKCPHCGADILPGSIFCNQCGNKIDE